MDSQRLQRLLDLLEKEAATVEAPFEWPASDETRRQLDRLLQHGADLQAEFVRRRLSSVRAAFLALRRQLQTMGQPLLPMSALGHSSHWPLASRQTFHTSLNTEEVAEPELLNQLLRLMRRVVDRRSTTKVTASMMGGYLAEPLFRYPRPLMDCRRPDAEQLEYQRRLAARGAEFLARLIDCRAVSCLQA